MSSMPAKYSRNWGTIFIIYFLALFNLFIISQIVLENNFSTKSIAGIAVLTFLSALLACVGGFLGGKMFFTIYTICLVLGLIYMFYIAVFDVSPNWGDLTSLLSYMFFVITGLVFGLTTEVVKWFKGRAKKPVE